MIRFLPLLILVLFSAPQLLAQAHPTQKQSPPVGVEIPAADRAELEAGVAELEKELAAIRSSAAQDRIKAGLLPDVAVLHKAIAWALKYDEFMDVKHVASAKKFLADGLARAKALRSGEAPWASSTGIVIRGYQSRIDDSVQPYGLVVPEDWTPGDTRPRPLLVWLAGRNDKRTELVFLEERTKGRGEFTPAGAFVLHPYGRFCNATKFAGETDVFEALASVRSRYKIDPERIAVGGFSMGGASAWHLALHHAGLWCAATSGAGFAETAVYAKVFAPGKTPPPAWEQQLWSLYDATKVAANLFNLPMLAYSGEIDPQKQSGDIMEKALAEEGLPLARIIGPKTAHKYEPGAKQEISRWLDEQIAKGREPMPPRVRFTTYTLRYPKMEWIDIDALEQHWTRADLDAELVDEGTVRVQTKNVAAFTIALPVSPTPLDKTHPPRVLIDEQEVIGPAVVDRWTAHFRKSGGKWALVKTRDDAAGKQPHLSGPIDDAFYDRFIFVRPTGKAWNEKVGAWAEAELQRAIEQWRTVFRGEPIVKNDHEITEEDHATANLVLWGDPGSNSVLAKAMEALPLKWSKDTVQLAQHSLSAAEHAPVMIYPNPPREVPVVRGSAAVGARSPAPREFGPVKNSTALARRFHHRRYIVLNSSFTFRAGSTVTNSQQTPKLPDWALIDLRTPPNNQAPGAIVDAGFFDEQWRVPNK